MDIATIQKENAFIILIWVKLFNACGPHVHKRLYHIIFHKYVQFSKCPKRHTKYHIIKQAWYIKYWNMKLHGHYPTTYLKQTRT